MTQPTRRNFLAGSAVVASSITLPQSLQAFSKARAAGDEELRVALIGCGNRGAGAAKQALSTAGKVRLVAMADAFSDRLEHFYYRYPYQHLLLFSLNMSQNRSPPYIFR